MNCNTHTITKIFLPILFCVVLCTQTSYGQEESSNSSSPNTYHNQLFFNRFLINPTFSLVRENKSYLNILHRNQYATFEDNSQNYFLTFSNKLNENTALGIGVYSKWAGVIQEFGFNANYATSVRLGEKSALTFGTNVTYFNEGLDKNRIVATENDPELLESTKESKIAIQPGITLSLGKFDFGLYAENLFKYNQTTNTFLTSLNDRSVKASVQYTHPFAATSGLFANARLMPLLQLGKNEDNSLSYIGALLLDLPDYGWFQTTLDDTYGMSLGLGFNLNKKMSIGYLMEKDLFESETDFGWNHELSLAYTFKNNTSDYGNSADISTDAKIDRIVRNYEEQILRLKAENKKEMAYYKQEERPKLKEDTDKKRARKKVDKKKQVEDDINTLAYQNRLILDELILRQDSVEKARDKAFEKRFETIVRLLRHDINRTIKSTLQESDSPANTRLAANESAPKPTKNDEAKPKVYKKPAQDLAVAQNKMDIRKTPSRATASKANVEDTKSLSIAEHKVYEKLPIRVLNRSDITGVNSGYYLIANVYKNKRYLNAFVNELTEQGLNPRQFYNKENGLYYVYLADFKMKNDAKTAVVSNLNGKYRDEKWIMQVSNSTATAQVVFED